MENQSTNQNNDVDLSEISKRLKGYATRLNDSFFDIILFIRRYIIAIVILVVAGVALGIYMDRGAKIYTHKVFVTPNFGSVDYLYEEVERIQAKIKERDTAYIKSMGIKNVSRLARVQIEPVVDIYDFMDENNPDQQNRKIELFKIISENGEMEKTLEDRTTSRNYKNHVIIFTTTQKYDEKSLIDPLLKTLNNDPYWTQVQKESQHSLETKVVENTLMIDQINKVLSEYGNVGSTSGVALRTDNTNISDLFHIKNMLLREQAHNRLSKIDFQKIVKDRGVILNVQKSGIVSGHTKLILPVIFLILFTIVVKFRDYYRSQLAKRNLK